MDETGLAKPVYHLHQMVFRDPITPGDFLDGREIIARSGAEIHQYAQGVVGIAGEAHGGVSSIIS
jgi:hypothetical protein